MSKKWVTCERNELLWVKSELPVNVMSFKESWGSYDESCRDSRKNISQKSEESNFTFFIQLQH